MAIHEQRYVEYEGPLKEGGAWWVLARTTIRLALSFLRTKLMILLTLIPSGIMVIAIFSEYAIRTRLAQGMGGEAPGPAGIGFYLQIELFSLALLFMASGCGVVSDDLRYRTFQLYFSRPVERWEYVVGKVLGLFMLGSIITIVPGVLLAAFRIVYFARTDFAEPIVEQTLVGLGLLVVVTAVVCAVVAGISAMTRRTGYAVLAWIGVLIVPMILGGILQLSTGGADWPMLLSLPGNVSLLVDGLLAETPPEVPLWAPALILGALGAAGLYGLYWRVHKLEGVA